MKKTAQWIKKVTALAALFTFSLNTLTGYSMGAVPTQQAGGVPSLARPASRALDLTAVRSIPEQTGSIGEIFSAPSAQAVIYHVQDAHTSLEAQQNIKKILEHLTMDSKTDTIFLEGALEEVHGDWLRFFQDEKANAKAAQLLARQGLIGGAELFLLEHDQANKNLRVLGVEDRDLYLKNLEAYRAVLSHQSEVKKFLDSLQNKILTAGSKVFNKKLSVFFKEWVLQTETLEDPFRHFKMLEKAAQDTLGINWDNPRSQIAWPQFYRLVKMTEFEKTADLAGAQKERTSLALWLAEKKAPLSILKQMDSMEQVLNSGKWASESPRKDMETMDEALQPLGFSFKDYPALSNALGRIILRSEIDAQTLMNESDEMRNQILDRLAQNPNEKKLVRVYQDYLLLKSVLALELSSEQYAMVLGRAKDMNPSNISSRLVTLVASPLLSASSPRKRGSIFSESRDSRQNIAAGDLQLTAASTAQSMPPARAGMTQGGEAGITTSIEALFTQALQFYKLAHQRDQVISENMLKKMQALGAHQAILITGGFHSAGLHDQWKKNGISFVELTPHLSEIKKDSGYENALLMNGDLKTRLTTVNAPRFAEGPIVLNRLGAYGSYYDAAGERVRDAVARTMEPPVVRKAIENSPRSAMLARSRVLLAAKSEVRQLTPANVDALFSQGNPLDESLAGIPRVMAGRPGVSRRGSKAPVVPGIESLESRSVLSSITLSPLAALPAGSQVNNGLGGVIQPDVSVISSGSSQVRYDSGILTVGYNTSARPFDFGGLTLRTPVALGLGEAIDFSLHGTVPFVTVKLEIIDTNGNKAIIELQSIRTAPDHPDHAAVYRLEAAALGGGGVRNIQSVLLVAAVPFGVVGHAGTLTMNFTPVVQNVGVTRLAPLVALPAGSEALYVLGNTDNVAIVSSSFPGNQVSYSGTPRALSLAHDTMLPGNNNFDFGGVTFRSPKSLVGVEFVDVTVSTTGPALSVIEVEVRGVNTNPGAPTVVIPLSNITSVPRVFRIPAALLRAAGVNELGQLILVVEGPHTGTASIVLGSNLTANNSRPLESNLNISARPFSLSDGRQAYDLYRNGTFFVRFDANILGPNSVFEGFPDANSSSQYLMASVRTTIPDSAGGNPSYERKIIVFNMETRTFETSVSVPALTPSHSLLRLSAFRVDFFTARVFHLFVVDPASGNIERLTYQLAGGVPAKPVGALESNGAYHVPAFRKIYVPFGPGLYQVVPALEHTAAFGFSSSFGQRLLYLHGPFGNGSVIRMYDLNRSDSDRAVFELALGVYVTRVDQFSAGYIEATLSDGRRAVYQEPRSIPLAGTGALTEDAEATVQKSSPNGDFQVSHEGRDLILRNRSGAELGRVEVDGAAVDSGVQDFSVTDSAVYFYGRTRSNKYLAEIPLTAEGFREPILDATGSTALMRELPPEVRGYSWTRVELDQANPGLVSISIQTANGEITHRVDLPTRTTLSKNSPNGDFQVSHEGRDLILRDRSGAELGRVEVDGGAVGSGLQDYVVTNDKVYVYGRTRSNKYLAEIPLTAEGFGQPVLNATGSTALMSALPPEVNQPSLWTNVQFVANQPGVVVISKLGQGAVTLTYQANLTTQPIVAVQRVDSVTVASGSQVTRLDTVDDVMALLQSKGITSVTRAQIEELPNRNSSKVTVTGKFVFLQSPEGDFAIAFTGVRVRGALSKPLTRVLLFHPGQVVPVAVHASASLVENPNAMGFTMEKRLVLWQTRGAESERVRVYNDDGKNVLRARTLTQAQPEAQSWTPTNHPDYAFRATPDATRPGYKTLSLLNREQQFSYDLSTMPVANSFKVSVSADGKLLSYEIVKPDGTRRVSSLETLQKSRFIPAVSNPNFSFGFTTGFHNTSYLYLFDVKAGHAQHLDTGTTDTYGKFWNVRDVSPDGKFVAFNVRESFVQIQRIDNPAVTPDIDLGSHYGIRGIIEWPVLPSGETAIVLEGVDRSRSTINPKNSNVVSFLPADWQPTSHPDYLFREQLQRPGLENRVLLLLNAPDPTNYEGALTYQVALTPVANSFTQVDVTADGMLLSYTVVGPDGTSLNSFSSPLADLIVGNAQSQVARSEVRLALSEAVLATAQVAGNSVSEELRRDNTALFLSLVGALAREAMGEVADSPKLLQILDLMRRELVGVLQKPGQDSEYHGYLYLDEVNAAQLNDDSAYGLMLLTLAPRLESGSQDANKIVLYVRGDAALAEKKIQKMMPAFAGIFSKIGQPDLAENLVLVNASSWSDSLVRKDMVKRSAPSRGQGLEKAIVSESPEFLAAMTAAKGTLRISRARVKHTHALLGVEALLAGVDIDERTHDILSMIEELERLGLSNLLAARMAQLMAAIKIAVSA